MENFQKKKNVEELKNKMTCKVEQFELSIVSLKDELTELTSQIDQFQSHKLQLQQDLLQLQQELSSCKVEQDQLQQHVIQQKHQIEHFSLQIKNKSQEINLIQKQSKSKELELTKVSNKLSRIIIDAKEAVDKQQQLLAQYSWLKDEIEHFNDNQDYNFTNVQLIKDNKTRLNKLKENQEVLSKNLNKKVMSMFEKVERQYNLLLEKRNIIDNDKLSIEQVISDLDTKKNQTLELALNKVNQDFGSIFGALLPGTSAKLAPLEGKSVLDGLEMKVAFNNSWKDSLSELSGGQRSLLSLSLILAFLLFKPAPMYILDEVDAALDLSHTQNIGRMLKTHFSSSQFIVVSLKQGMFNNANCLFRTKFVDGVSTVRKTVNNNNDENNVLINQKKNRRNKAAKSSSSSSSLASLNRNI